MKIDKNPIVTFYEGMEWEMIFRLANLVILGGFTLIRIPYILASINHAANPQDKRTSIVYGIISAVMVIVGFGYLYHPSIFSWFDVNLPTWIRLLGILIGVLGDGLLLWTHIALDRNFAMYVTSTKDHELVTSGPYATVRHPMYSAFIMIALGFFLVSSNLLMGGFVVLMIYPLFYRMNIEEEYLLNIFGEDYTSYMKTTKRLIPFIY